MAAQGKGPIPQHKSMAMGKMPKVSGNSGKTGFEKSGGATDGKVRKSGTSTGSGSGKSGY